MGMAGWLSALTTHARFDEASRLSSELVSLLESIGDPTLTLGLLWGPVAAKYLAGELSEALRLAQRQIELADGDATNGNVVIGSPLGGAILLRGCARCCAGDPNWKGDIETGQAMSDVSNVTQRGITVLFKYGLTLLNGVALPDAAALQETAQMLELAERSGDDYTLSYAQYVRGSTLVRHGGPQRAEGLSLLAAARDAALQERSSLMIAAMVDIWSQQKGQNRRFDRRDRIVAGCR